MRRSQFSGDQIVRFLEEAASGSSVRELCDRYGFSAATFFRWKARYEGLPSEDVARFRALEEELHELRRQVRMAEREREAVRVLLNEAYSGGRERRLAIERLQVEGGISERRACEAFGIPRTTHRRRERSASPGEPVVASTVRQRPRAQAAEAG